MLLQFVWAKDFSITLCYIYQVIGRFEFKGLEGGGHLPPMPHAGSAIEKYHHYNNACS